MKKWDPKCVAAGKTFDNYWAGAKKACDDIGMSLPDKSKLERLAKKTTAEKEQLGLPTSGWFWSSEDHSYGLAYDGNFDYGGYTDINYKSYSDRKVLCVGD